MEARGAVTAWIVKLEDDRTATVGADTCRLVGVQDEEIASVRDCDLVFEIGGIGMVGCWPRGTWTEIYNDKYVTITKHRRRRNKEALDVASDDARAALETPPTEEGEPE